MEFSIEQYESIQLYLDDKMTPEQEKQFMLEVNNNALLQENLQFEIDLRQNLFLQNRKQKSSGEVGVEYRSIDESNIKSLIEKAGKEWLRQKKSTKSISLPLWLRIAAAACLLVVVTGIVWYLVSETSPVTVANNNKADTSEKQTNVKPEIVVNTPPDSLTNKPVPVKIDYANLFDSFFAKDNIPDQKPRLLADALNDYADSHYTTIQTIDLANIPILRSPPGNDEDVNSNQNIQELGHYYKGLAFIQTNNAKKAEENLQWVIGHAKNKQLITKAKWYLALIHLKKGNSEKALPLLNSVANSKITSYNRHAKELLKELKK